MSFAKQYTQKRAEYLKEPYNLAQASVDKPREGSYLQPLETYQLMWPERGKPTFVEVEHEKNLDPDEFLRLLKAKYPDAVDIHKNTAYDADHDKFEVDDILMFIKEGYMLAVEVHQHNSKSDFNEMPKSMIRWLETHKDIDTKMEKGVTYDVIIGFEVYAPSWAWIEANDKEDEFNEFIQSLREMIKETQLELKGEASKIGMITAKTNGLDVNWHDLTDKTPDFIKPDLFYGEGFGEFHESLLKRLETDTKGLVLLHGDPGTGKTHYIRVLLRELAALNKNVFYVPPSMVHSLADPGMVNFMSKKILEEEEDTILLIEDAEPLLASREYDHTGRSTGITNLLNSTDGILNDILGLVVIATFNTSLENIDKALLRPERLIARKFFLKHNRENAEEIAKELGVEGDLPESEDEMWSIADLCGAKQERGVLIHGEKKERKKIGFGSK